jgi:hypothetical protein
MGVVYVKELGELVEIAGDDPTEEEMSLIIGEVDARAATQEASLPPVEAELSLGEIGRSVLATASRHARGALVETPAAVMDALTSSSEPPTAFRSSTTGPLNLLPSGGRRSEPIVSERRALIDEATARHLARQIQGSGGVTGYPIRQLFSNPLVGAAALGMKTIAEPVNEVWKEWEHGLHTPTVSLDEAIDDPTGRNVGIWVAETGIGSLPGMALAVASLPLFAWSIAGERAKTRAANRGEAVSPSDVMVGAASAAIEGGLEKTAALFHVAASSGNLALRTFKRLLVEATTEGVQEVDAILAEELFTSDKGFYGVDPDRAIRRTGGAAFLGGIMGTTVGGGADLARRMRRAPVDPDIDPEPVAPLLPPPEVGTLPPEQMGPRASWGPDVVESPVYRNPAAEVRLDPTPGARPDEAQNVDRDWWADEALADVGGLATEAAPATPAVSEPGAVLEIAAGPSIEEDFDLRAPFQRRIGERMSEETSARIVSRAEPDVVPEIDTSATVLLPVVDDRKAVDDALAMEAVVEAIDSTPDEAPGAPPRPKERGATPRPERSRKRQTLRAVAALPPIAADPTSTEEEVQLAVFGDLAARNSEDAGPAEYLAAQDADTEPVARAILEDMGMEKAQIDAHFKRNDPVSAAMLFDRVKAEHLMSVIGPDGNVQTPQAVEQIIKLVADTAYVPTDVESTAIHQAMMLNRRARLDALRELEAISEKGDKAAIDALNAKISTLGERVTSLVLTSRTGGSKQGSALRSRQYHTNEVLDLPTAIGQAIHKNGGKPLTEKQKSRLKERYEEGTKVKKEGVAKRKKAISEVKKAADAVKKEKAAVRKAKEKAERAAPTGKRKAQEARRDAADDLIAEGTPGRKPRERKPSERKPGERKPRDAAAAKPQSKRRFVFTGYPRAERAAKGESKTRERAAKRELTSAEKKLKARERELQKAKDSLANSNRIIREGQRLESSAPERAFEGGWGAVKGVYKRNFIASKMLSSSLDLSAYGRQGIWLVARHPIHAVLSIPRAVASFRSPSKALEWQTEMMSRPIQLLRNLGGLEMTSVEGVSNVVGGSPVNAVEEEMMYAGAVSGLFGDNVLSRVIKGEIGAEGSKVREVAEDWSIDEMVRGSNNSYALVLNSLRTRNFDLGMEMIAADLGLANPNAPGATDADIDAFIKKVNPVDIKAIARTANVITGRGKLVTGTGAFAEGARWTLYAPRFTLSRIESPYRLTQFLMKKGPYEGMSDGARAHQMQLAQSALVYFLATGLLAAWAGPDDWFQNIRNYLNPLHPDYDKIVSPDGLHHMVMGGGLGTTNKYLIPLSTDPGEDGRVIPSQREYGDRLGRMISNKLGPLARALSTAVFNLGGDVKREDFGEDYDGMMEYLFYAAALPIGSAYTPIIAQGQAERLRDLSREEIDALDALVPLAVETFGFGVQTYKGD